MKPRRFAEGTSVTVEKTQAELVGLLKKHGATGFAFGEQDGVARILFQMGGRQVRFEIKVPSVAELLVEGERQKPRVRHGWWSLSASDKARWAQSIRAQRERERWRALLLVCKAKLELIADGMGTIESEFLAQAVLPNGRLVGEWLAPQIAAAYDSGEMPPLLPGRSE